MEVQEFEIKGVKLFRPRIFQDSRGYFLESYNNRVKDELNTDFIQDNESKSGKGTLRGLHFQKGNHSQAKLVRATTGKVQDVIVDLRSDSTTFGKHLSFILDDAKKEMLFVPKGFAHAFLVLSDFAIFSYKVDHPYNKAADSGIYHADVRLGIKWEIDLNDRILSEKDQNLMSFDSFCKSPCF